MNLTMAMTMGWVNVNWNWNDDVVEAEKSNERKRLYAFLQQSRNLSKRNWDRKERKGNDNDFRVMAFFCVIRFHFATHMF